MIFKNSGASSGGDLPGLLPGCTANRLSPDYLSDITQNFRMKTLPYTAVMIEWHYLEAIK